MRATLSVLTLIAVGLPACAERAPDAATDGAPSAAAASVATSQDVYWASLTALCGQAFAGRTVESVPPDPAMESARLVMHVRECSDGEIRIPFFVDADRSRTWVLTRTGEGIRLKHDHRHEDGSEDAVTQYGGDSQGEGMPGSQDFFADDFTAELVPTAANNVWTIEVDPGRTFAYVLRREGSDRAFRAEFDLTATIETPLPPWGS